MKCPNCGTVNSPGEEFCTNCGFYIGSAPPPVSNTGSMPTLPAGAAQNTSTSTFTGPGSGNSRTLTPNSRLENGRYVVEKILGEGGMGAAVLARDTRVSNKAVVIKELVSDNTDPAKRQEDVENFEREVATLATIDHPLVPTVTDSFQEGTRYFMVQEYAAGENLEQHVERLNRPLPEQEVLTYASQVLDILDYLSQQQPPIVHRDIKPANIIIGAKDKRARLVDFGIARADVAKNAKRKQTTALGTPGYAPPEQYQGNADARSDMYALAATMHHLLTNRDPRNYPPFTYPPARTLNPQITSDTELLLVTALQIDPSKRFQTAAAMKRDVDQILADHFGSSGDTSTYIIGSSGTLQARSPQPTAARPQAGYAGNTQRSTIPPPPPPPPYVPQRTQTQVGGYTQPPTATARKSGSGGLVRNFVLLLLVLGLIGSAAFFILPKLANRGSTGTSGSTPTTSAGSTPGSTSNSTIPISKDSEGVITFKNEQVGLSFGSYAFDTGGTDGAEKQQAAEALRNGNPSTASSLWRSYLNKNTTDAEARIYLENQSVILSGSPYITLAVGTMLTGTNEYVQTGRDSLQGAYIAQKQFNANAAQHANVKLRLLVVNSGSDATSATTAASAIVEAAKQDKTLIGVMGWPYSSRAQNALGVLSRAKIPMISQTASSTDLSGASPYFFRVAPSDKSQGEVGANYAKTKLNAKRVTVFSDDADSYSRSLADSFVTPFKQAGGEVISEKYTRGDAASIKEITGRVLQQNPLPDLIYFAGYTGDISALLDAIPASSKIQVLGGDALYNLGGYSNRQGFTRLRFTAFAYPDEWGILKYGDKQPAFFKDYASTYDPTNKYPKGNYGYSRPANKVILSYDATLTLVTAAERMIKATEKTQFTGDDLRNALVNIKGANAVQGVSGQVSFNADGDPDQKAVVILRVSSEGFIQMEPELGAGKFLVS